MKFQTPAAALAIAVGMLTGACGPTSGNLTGTGGSGNSTGTAGTTGTGDRHPAPV